MDNNIKVSVVCNTFNHGNYIKSALDGFVNQKTDFKFEVLIHDDASTDKTPEIIREYEKKYPDIIKPIYQTENQYSQKIPFVSLYQKTRVMGKYVAFCEGDDYWTDPLKLQKQYDFLESHPEYSMCVCSTSWLNMMTGRIENKGKINEDADIPLQDIILEKNGRIFQYATILVRTPVWLANPEWAPQFPIGDLPLAIKAGLAGRVRMLADNMAVYRYNAKGSWTARMDNDQKRAEISQKMIRGFEALDNATEGKYNAVIHKRIIRHKYTLALMTHDLKALKSDELNPVFKSRNVLLRLSDLFRCRFPKIYKALRKVSKKIVK